MFYTDEFVANLDGYMSGFFSKVFYLILFSSGLITGIDIYLKVLENLRS